MTLCPITIRTRFVPTGIRVGATASVVAVLVSLSSGVAESEPALHSLSSGQSSGAELFFADSLFLKSPARIMAMIMIMGLCLLIYALAEWHIRQQLQEKNETIPDQRGQPTQTPTMRRIAQMFEGVDLLIIREGSRVVERQVLKLTPVRLQLIRLFGPTVQNCYLVDS